MSIQQKFQQGSQDLAQLFYELVELIQKGTKQTSVSTSHREFAEQLAAQKGKMFSQVQKLIEKEQQLNALFDER